MNFWRPGRRFLPSDGKFELRSSIFMISGPPGRDLGTAKKVTFSLSGPLSTGRLDFPTDTSVRSRAPDSSRSGQPSSLIAVPRWRFVTVVPTMRLHSSSWLHRASSRKGTGRTSFNINPYQGFLWPAGGSRPLTTLAFSPCWGPALALFGRMPHRNPMLGLAYRDNGIFETVHLSQRFF